jgi:hypothetical protein
LTVANSPNRGQGEPLVGRATCALVFRPQTSAGRQRREARAAVHARDAGQGTGPLIDGDHAHGALQTHTATACGLLFGKPWQKARLYNNGNAYQSHRPY